MKANVFLASFFVFCLGIHGQQIVDLTTGNIMKTDYLSTAPLRNVVENDAGYTVSYSYTYMGINEDPLFPNAQIVEMEGLSRNCIAGEPSTLFQWDLFSVPQGKTFSVSVVDSSYIDIPIVLSPSHPMHVPKADISASDVLPITPYGGFSPGNILSEVKEVSYRGRRIACLNIRPMKYHYDNHILRVYSKLVYRISFEETNRPTSSLMSSLSPSDAFLNNITINGCSPHRSITSSQSENTIDYLIISSSDYEESISRFAEWKRTMGYNVHISLRDSWSPDTIKSVVQSFYENTNSLYYLLIVGGYTDVPGEYCADGVNNVCYTDFFYGCVDGDSLPDIHVGRIPVDSPEGATIVFDKIIKYEKTPLQDASFYNTGVHCTYFNSVNGIYPKLGSMMPKTVEIATQYMNTLGRIAHRVYYAQPSDNPQYWGDMTQIPNYLKKPNFPWDGNGDSISYYINEGALYVFTNCHGNEYGWQYPDFLQYYIDNLENGMKMPIVFSLSCTTGKYWIVGDCFAESFLKKSQGGCVAIIAATSEAFEPPIDFFGCGIMNAVWPVPGMTLSFNNYTNPPNNGISVYSLGEIMDQAKIKMVNSFPTYDLGLLYNMAVFHCFGDPSIEMMTEMPTSFQQVSINRTSNGINVVLGEQATISFYDQSTNDVVSYFGSSASYNGSPDNVIVCVRKHNKKPYIDYPETLYIQNKTISASSEFHANHIYVGSSVNSALPTGPVVINGGLIGLYGNQVEISGTTTVNIGASLEITKEE